ncbi:MAG TPA: hypothetical protein H9754_00905 [Candidatus Anaerostipes avistercoris]|uniref:Uncharacterized protein n=1 Tax=Candidatus Anaerostipes avistercoris TaxID=2838462 RepID=A0A9D2PGC9_9FIRM|nr:hypothetical protein [uncultured Anaerostipes sp.]HJC49133.1 hypothetical protein [Candidatus Anaerostipes avistercoris]
MVYCNYKSHNKETATYAYGGTVDDITGELVFYFQKDAVEIIKEPLNGNAPMRHIMSLYGAHRKQFKSGCFKKKIAYEA